MLRSLVDGWHLPLTVLLWLLVAALVVWALRAVPVASVLGALEGLHLMQVAALLVLNAAVILCLTWRWWVILRAQGANVPFLTLAGYRLAAFGVSYFTPGPQVGGETLQVAFGQRRHGVSGPTATAAVVLDRGIDFVVNLGVLIAGLATASRGTLPGVTLGGVSVVGLGLLGLAVGFVLAVGMGNRPLHAVLTRLRDERDEVSRRRAIIDFIIQSEAEAARFCREQPGTVLMALFVSAVVWVLMLAELGLALHALGLVLTPTQVAAVLVAMRIAFMLPSPGALGTLEAGQVLVFQAMGLDPAAGLGLSLIIRARDVLFGVVGLLLGGVYGGALSLGLLNKRSRGR